MTGIAIGAWATSAAGPVDMERPSSLIIHGPYRFSRNPMYLAWALLVFGVALLLYSPWLAVANIVAWLYSHVVTIPNEERAMRNSFGQEYEVYKTHVRRWL